MNAFDPLNKPTVLVVDDTPDNLSLMSGLLKGHYKVKVASSGEKALKMVAEHLPDLILLDVMMPGMDGREVCRQLKDNPRTAGVPVIFLTSNSEECDEELGLNLGAVDYITKPFSIPITLARIRNHTRMKQQADQLAAMAVESERLKNEAQRATRTREDVLAVVAHDLRTPLATILMGAGFLQESGEDPFLASAKMGARIFRAASRMDALIKDLLDLAAIEAGRLAVDPQPVKAQALASDAIDMMQSLAKARGLQLTAELESGEQLLSCDRGRVLQVFSNLIGNAIKFTPSGGRITVLGANGASAYRFTIADTGAGITAEQLPHIFDRYWQAGNKDHRGVGLGLSIAAGIVAAHGERLWVDSEVGKGSAFQFTLPRTS